MQTREAIKWHNPQLYATPLLKGKQIKYCLCLKESGHRKIAHLLLSVEESEQDDREIGG